MTRESQTLKNLSGALLRGDCEQIFGPGPLNAGVEGSWSLPVDGMVATSDGACRLTDLCVLFRKLISTSKEFPNETAVASGRST
jgi:hypothetical protein